MFPLRMSPWKGPQNSQEVIVLIFNLATFAGLELHTYVEHRCLCSSSFQENVLESTAVQ